MTKYSLLNPYNVTCVYAFQEFLKNTTYFLPVLEVRIVKFSCWQVCLLKENEEGSVQGPALSCR